MRPVKDLPMLMQEELLRLLTTWELSLTESLEKAFNTESTPEEKKAACDHIDNQSREYGWLTYELSRRGIEKNTVRDVIRSYVGLSAESGGRHGFMLGLHLAGGVNPYDHAPTRGLLQLLEAHLDSCIPREKIAELEELFREYIGCARQFSPKDVTTEVLAAIKALIIGIPPAKLSSDAEMPRSDGAPRPLAASISAVPHHSRYRLETFVEKRDTGFFSIFSASPPTVRRAPELDNFVTNVTRREDGGFKIIARATVPAVPGENPTRIVILHANGTLTREDGSSNLGKVGEQIKHEIPKIMTHFGITDYPRVPAMTGTVSTPKPPGC